jgi:hypothetical protein
VPAIQYRQPFWRRARFVDAVANGKRNMPAWDNMLDPEALWAYVIAGEAVE